MASKNVAPAGGSGQGSCDTARPLIRDRPKSLPQAGHPLTKRCRARLRPSTGIAASKWIASNLAAQTKQVWCISSASTTPARSSCTPAEACPAKSGRTASRGHTATYVPSGHFGHFGKRSSAGRNLAPNRTGTPAIFSTDTGRGSPAKTRSSPQGPENSRIYPTVPLTDNRSGCPHVHRVVAAPAGDTRTDGHPFMVTANVARPPARPRPSRRSTPGAWSTGLEAPVCGWPLTRQLAELRSGGR